MGDKTLIGKFLVWRAKNINDRYFIIILSALIGFLAGMAAYLLKTSVFYIHDTLTEWFTKSEQNYLFVIYPGIGILLTVVFLKYIVRDETRHGIPRILYVISKLGGKMKQHKVFSSLVGSSLTAGFGGSIGLEAPIISTGSSMGSNIGSFLRLNYKTTTLLIGCGAAGAMASIFTTPIAAVVFSLEVLMLDLTISSIIPLLMASATGAITTKFLLAEENLVHFDIPIHFDISDVPWFLALGIITGLVSLYFNKMTYFVSDNMERIKSRWKRLIVGGTLIGVLLFLFPALYGEGYETIRQLLKGDAGEVLDYSFFYDYRDNLWVFTLYMIFLVLTKVIAMALTVSAGGVGGIFAPSAVTGGYVGFVFARILNETGITDSLSENNFTLVGMAGVLGAVLHAPLTAIFLIAEMTNGYELIVPLRLTSIISFVTIKTFDPHSIFTKRLAERGELLTHHKDQAVLTLLNIRDVIDKDILTIHPDATLDNLTRVIAKSKRNLFPVVDENNIFIGLVVLDDVREDMFKKEMYNNPVTNYMLTIPAEEKVSIVDSMDVVMEKFNRTGHYNLVVLNKGRYVGFVSRANVFNAYRQTLIDVSQE